MTFTSRTLWWVLCALSLSACVTINVYFPEAAAEKAADRIINDVWGKDSQPAGSEPDARLPQSNLLAAVLDWVITPAHAEADLEISTPAINKLKASMQERHIELAPYYDAGAVGLTGDGLIAVRDAKLVELSKRNELKKLVDADNRDRNALYETIAEANGHPEWESDIRATFAGRWISKAKAGWWYDAGAGWQQK